MFTKNLPSPVTNEQRSNVPHRTGPRPLSIILLRGYCRSKDYSKASAPAATDLIPTLPETRHHRCNPAADLRKTRVPRALFQGQDIHSFQQQVDASVYTCGERATNDLSTCPLDNATARIALQLMTVYSQFSLLRLLPVAELVLPCCSSICKLWKFGRS